MARAGILELQSQGFGMLRTAANWLASPNDVFVPQGLVRKLGLRTGQRLEVQARPRQGSDRHDTAAEVVTVEGQPPDQAREWPQFEALTAESPRRRMRLATDDGGPDAARAVDLLAPVGYGTRGLIVAPPFAGKTQLLATIARTATAADPNLELLILLVDERPEEVTEFRRESGGTVIASSYDSAPGDHIRLAELVLARAQRLVECGRDVLLLMDSLTRLTRAVNLEGKGSGRTLSGGLDPASLRFPRKMFGAARATEEAGSLTLLATVLVQTESRLDDLIFEEFKGTGNWELRLDRKLAEHRVFPAIDIPGSGTRREELLYTDAELAGITKLRRYLREMAKGNQAQMELLLQWLRKFPSNQQLMDVVNQGQ